MKNPYWHPEEKNHIVNPDEVRELAFDVFNIVQSSMSMRGRGAPKDEDEDSEPTSIVHMHYELAEYQLSSKLLRIAVLVRTLDDYWSSWGHEDYVKAVANLNRRTDIGTLTVKEKSTDLTLREAFNKIIHAADVRPVYETEDDRDDEHARWGMDGQLELSGEFKKGKWGALINLLPFLDAVVDLLKVVEELES